MVEFAPLFVPWERRLQTLATVQWVFSAFSCLLLPSSAQICTAIFVGLLFTRFWFISILYTFWWYLERDRPRRGGRRLDSIRHWHIWKYMRDYFPVLLVKTAELDPSRNYLAGFHPHGILATGALTNLCTESTGFSSLFPGIRPNLMTLNLFFRVPFFRDYIMSGVSLPTPGWGKRRAGGMEEGLWGGSLSPGLVSADKESGDHILSREGGGNLLGIVIGGVREAENTRPGSYKLVLRNRKGFVRLALRHG
ncbi:2-acylglycerol O-acyltransferase 2-like [Sus scrofa]|uniref:2-acylglycerol O-acyltransferase 2-like n=1 Tax=Sus scrofa TaxID=9823 RepID=UPI000A2B8EEC|nr:2-acylglycerol O-acyltransferase 2-like [Sus scrofa]